MDIWQYIAVENIALPSIYYSHKRKVIHRDGMLLAESEFLTLQEHEKYEERIIRYRTLGDMTCTGAVDSQADTIEKIIEEVASSRVTERGGRADDKRSETAMEDRKKEGYF